MAQVVKGSPQSSSPRQDENFGANKCLIAFLVPEIWLFEVEICARSNFLCEILVLFKCQYLIYICGSVITFLQLNLNQLRLIHILRIVKVDQCQFTCSFPLEWDQRKFTHLVKITQHSRKTCWAMLTGGANSAMASEHQSCAVTQTVHTNHGLGKHPLWCSLPLITFWCAFS